MKQGSLDEVIGRLLFEIDKTRIKLQDLEISLATVSRFRETEKPPEKPVERLPLFTVSKPAPKPERAPRAKLARGTTQEKVLEILREHPGIKVGTIRQHARGVLTAKMVSNALGRLKKEGLITLNSGIYRLVTSGTADPTPSPED